MRSALLILIGLLSAPEAFAEVSFREGDETLSVSFDGKPFTVYRHGPGVSKPFFWPIQGPGGVAVTRAFPNLPDVPGESRDHLWHRGLSFTHGDVEVEGLPPVDFWAEGRKVQGRIVHRGFDPSPVVEGNVLRFGTRNDWLTPDGTACLVEKSLWRLENLGGGSGLISLVVELRAGAKAVRFGDTKEGCFSVRVATNLDELAESNGLRAQSPRGRVEDSHGVAGAGQLWGKPADWVDDSGRVEGQAVGIALFDHPANQPRTRWHVRDYGLLSANPLGEKAFGVPSEGRGVRLESGKSITFRFALLVHAGDARTGEVAQRYRAYVEREKLAP